MRVKFCGVIEGSVTVRPGEDEMAAITRAEEAINSVLERYARLFGREAEPDLTREQLGRGPIVGLEPND